MIRKNLIQIILIFSVSAGCIAQTTDTVSFQQLLAVALENNFDIRIAKNSVQISENNNSLVAAGLLPQADVGMSLLQSKTNSQTKYFDGSETNMNSLGNTTFNTFVQLNWTLFDGMAMFIRKKRLSEYENQSELKLLAASEAVYLQLGILYYELMYVQKMRDNLKYSIEISRFRKQLTEKKATLGAASEIDIIQARFDFNTDSALCLKVETQMQNLKIEINTLIGRQPDLQFSAKMDSLTGENLKWDELQRSFYEQNSAVLIAKSKLKVSESIYKENRAELFPQISLYADYDFNYSENTAGNYMSNKLIGPSAGIRLSYRVFDGFSKKRQIQNSKIEMNSAQIDADRVFVEIQSELHQTYSAYRSAIAQYNLEKENAKDIRKNLQLALEIYKRGAMNEIEFRAIQQKTFEAEMRLSEALYLVKTHELKLLQLSGKFATKE